MEIIYGTQQWVKLYETLPNFEGIPEFEKPVKISTTETLVDEYTGDQLLQIARSNQDLFGGAVLDVDALDALNPDDVLAYYLNVRYNATPPNHLIPMRRAHMFGQSNHLYSWYLLMSAILTKLYDSARLSIDRHTLFRADQLSRVIAQVNWIIREMTKNVESHTYPGLVIVGYAKVTSKNGEYHQFVFDKDKFDTLMAQGRTAQDLATHWIQNKTQPT